jgi:hypothetical protein
LADAQLVQKLAGGPVDFRLDRLCIGMSVAMQKSFYYIDPRWAFEWFRVRILDQQRPVFRQISTEYATMPETL